MCFTDKRATIQTILIQSLNASLFTSCISALKTPNVIFMLSHDCLQLLKIIFFSKGLFSS